MVSEVINDLEARFLAPDWLDSRPPRRFPELHLDVQCNPVLPRKPQQAHVPAVRVSTPVLALGRLALPPSISSFWEVSEAMS